MMEEIEGDIELQRILWACYEYWKNEKEVEPDRREICYKWVNRLFRDKYKSDFHPSRLAYLAKIGILKKEDISRGGNRRYYSIVNPKGVEEMLRRFGLLTQ